jgi:hypothetical protein
MTGGSPPHTHTPPPHAHSHTHLARDVSHLEAGGDDGREDEALLHLGQCFINVHRMEIDLHSVLLARVAAGGAGRGGAERGRVGLGWVGYGCGELG